MSSLPSFGQMAYLSLVRRVCFGTLHQRIHLYAILLFHAFGDALQRAVEVVGA